MPRYIDADLIPYTEAEWARDDYASRYDIEEIPTANVQEVKHGYWRPKYISGTSLKNGMVSSCCDAWNERPTPFCPNCGAKMDGKEDSK